MSERNTATEYCHAILFLSQCSPFDYFARVNILQYKQYVASLAWVTFFYVVFPRQPFWACKQGRNYWGGGGGGGVVGRGVTPQKKVNKGAQLAERGAWNAGIAGRVKY
jgi:hypothetical protein